MTDLARICGVSQPTVSDVLNGKWREKGIAEATRDRILAAARRLSFRRNGIARRLSSGKTKFVGLVLPYIIGTFFAEITFALEMEARRRGYHVILCHSYGQREREQREIELLLELCVDGLIVVPAFDAPTGAVYAEMRQFGLPLVFLDSEVRGVEAHFVATDDVLGGLTATRHLIELGHRRIAHLAGPQVEGASTWGRREGYERALEEAGLATDADLVAEMEVGESRKAYEAVSRWLASGSGITAVFAASDTLAAAAVNALRDRDLSAPRDVAVVGYGDLASINASGLRLSTSRQPTQGIGRAAAEVLIDAVEGEAEGVVRRLLEPRLIVRDSCGGPNKTDDTDVPFWVALYESGGDPETRHEGERHGNASPMDAGVHAD